jgi:hypothetical protein
MVAGVEDSIFEPSLDAEERVSREINDKRVQMSNIMRSLYIVILSLYRKSIEMTPFMLLINKRANKKRNQRTRCQF